MTRSEAEVECHSDICFPIVVPLWLELPPSPLTGASFGLCHEQRRRGRLDPLPLTAETGKGYGFIEIGLFLHKPNLLHAARERELELCF